MIFFVFNLHYISMLFDINTTYYITCILFYNVDYFPFAFFASKNNPIFYV